MSKIFQGYRSVGAITNHVPCVLHKAGDHFLVTSCTGKGFQMYSSERLNLVFIGKGHGAEISAMASHSHQTFVGYETGEIRLFERGRVICSYTGHTAAVKQMLVIGNTLISFSANNDVIVWDTLNHELYLHTSFPKDDFEITCLAHPSTYLNKILIGSRQGTAKLFNYKTNKQIYQFQGWPRDPASTVGTSNAYMFEPLVHNNSSGSARQANPILCIEQTPALDILAFGLADGTTVLHNTKLDKEVMIFKQAYGPVTRISFRTDKAAVMAIASGATLCLWDLENRRLINALGDLHTDAISTLVFLPSQPVLLTASVDNSLKMWSFDTADANPRLLKQRSGHSGPATKVSFYSNDGKFFLSSGSDAQFRSYCAYQDGQNIELSQKSAYAGRAARRFAVSNAMDHPDQQHHRLPPVTSFASETNREMDWDNLVTCHLGLLEARTWRYDNKVIGKHVLVPPKFLRTTDFARLTTGAHHYTNPHFIRASLPSPSTTQTISNSSSSSSSGSTSSGSDALAGEATESDSIDKVQSNGDFGCGVVIASCCTLSACGNFAVVGYTDGFLHKFNMQSGLHRGQFGANIPPHSGGVSGVVCDAIGGTMVSGGHEGMLRFWNFAKLKCTHSIYHGTGIFQLVLQRDTQLLAVAGSDHVIKIYDLASKKLVRVFSGFIASITDMAFSGDARWLIAASRDTTVRVFDIATATLIDVFRTPDHVTSLAVSAQDHTLLMTHQNRIAITMWANRTLFTNVSLAPLPSPSLAQQESIPIADIDLYDTIHPSFHRYGLPPSTFNGDGNNIDNDHEDLDGAEEVKDHDAGDQEQYSKWTSPKQLMDELVTLAGVSEAKWLSLVHLDVIKQRNRPIEPPKKDKASPFFLASTSGLKPVFVTKDEEAAMEDQADLVETDMDRERQEGLVLGNLNSTSSSSSSQPATSFVNEQTPAGASKLLRMGDIEIFTPFTLQLRESAARREYTKLAEMLRAMSPSGMDLEIRSLSGDKQLGEFIQFLLHELGKNAEFELMQALLNIFLKIHCDALVVTTCPRLQSHLVELRGLQSAQWSKIASLIDHTECLVSYFKSTTL